jgi:hypothetical protein
MRRRLKSLCRDKSSNIRKVKVIKNEWGSPGNLRFLISDEIEGTKWVMGYDLPEYQNCNPIKCDQEEYATVPRIVETSWKKN